MDYKYDEIFLSFNGGKDCTVLLDITVNVLRKLFKTTSLCDKLKIVYISSENPFPELEEFVKLVERYYDLKLVTEKGDLKSALIRILERDSRLKACLMGTRKSDPYCENLNFFQVIKKKYNSTFFKKNFIVI